MLATLLFLIAGTNPPNRCVVFDGQSLAYGGATVSSLGAAAQGNNMRPAVESVTTNGDTTTQVATDSAAWPWASLTNATLALEHPRVGFANYIQSKMSIDVFTPTSARGASTFSVMGDGSLAWLYVSQQIESFGARTRGNCIAITEDHGEADQDAGTSTAAYSALLLARQQFIQDKIRRSTWTAVNDPNITVPLYVSQLSSWVSGAAPGSAQGALLACRTYPGIIACSGPKDWLDYQAIDRHLINTSSRAMGRMHGKAIAYGQACTGGDLCAQHSLWTPLWITAVSRSTTTIIVTYHVPCQDTGTCGATPLQFDTTTITGVSSATQGYEYTGATITAAAICTGTNAPVTGCVSTNQVALTINASAGGQLRYAYTGTGSTTRGRTAGVRGTLADTDTDTQFNYAMIAEDWTVP